MSIDDYGAALKKSGTTVLPGTPGTIWTGYEAAAMVRFPPFYTTPVSQFSARQVLWKGRAAVISFLMEPDTEHAPNAWLYVCRDRTYTLDKLPREARRDARRAQRLLQLGPIDWPKLLEKGLEAYSDTRTRVGLSDGSADHFRRRFENYASNPTHYVAGAWKGTKLVAFMTLIVVDHWVTIEGSFSTSSDRDQCPNNGLAHYVLDHFLSKRGFETVCYGTSSIQETSHQGLHSYKTRIGFEARPVHRTFMLHPVLRPLCNPLTLWSMKTALRFKPANRRLRKAIGVVNYMLSDKRTTHMAEEPVTWTTPD